MALSFALDGNLLIQLTPEARPQPIPVKFALSYTKKAMFDFVLPPNTSNLAAGPGSVTAPKFVLIWVREGSVDFSWASNGAGAITISANPDPPPADVPVVILMRHEPDAATLYMSCTDAARCDVWLLS